MARLDNDTKRRLYIAPTGGVVAGTPIKVEDTVVVPIETAAQTVAFVGVHKGIVRDAPKAASEVWAAGDALYWDDSAGCFTTGTDTGTNKLAAIAHRPAISAATVGDIELLGRPQV